MRILIALLFLALAACASPVPVPGCIAPASRPGGVQSCFQGAIRVDKATYAPGDTVQIVETATNTCSQPVGGPSACGARGIYATNAAGTVVWREMARGVACPALVMLVPPGSSVSYQTAWTTPSNLPRGGYLVVGPPNYGAAGFSVC